MIFRLKTARQTEDIFRELERRMHLKPYTLVKHAIAWSLKDEQSVKDFQSDSNGIDLNRQTITGNYDTYFKVLIEQVEGENLKDEDFFPHYVKAHIDRGAPILLDMFNHAGGVDKYVMQGIGIGGTV